MTLTATPNTTAALGYKVTYNPTDKTLIWGRYSFRP